MYPEKKQENAEYDFSQQENTSTFTPEMNNIILYGSFFIRFITFALSICQLIITQMICV